MTAARNEPVDWRERRVAVTGATGFLGHHLAVRLLSAGANVHAVAREGSDVHRLVQAGAKIRSAGLDDVGRLARAFEGAEIVFHLASAVDFEDDWERFRRVNVGGTRHVLAAARLAGVRRVVHASSIVAVGASRRPKILDETAEWDLGRYRAPYVTTKRQAEREALAANDDRLGVVVVNPASILGPDDYRRSEFGTLCRRFWKGRIPFHFGGGNNFVDVRDVAAGTMLAAGLGRAGERYILGGENRTMDAFFADLAAASGRSIFRLRLPSFLSRGVAAVQDALPRRPSARAYLSRSQARLASLYFFYTSAKALRELGYRPRSLRESIADSFEFWMKRSAG